MGDDTFDETASQVDVLIQVAQADPGSMENIIQFVQNIQGRVLHVYPPYLIMARITKTSIDTIRKDPAVYSVDTEEIRGERLETDSEILKVAFAAWNEYLLNQSTRAASQGSAFQSWDAPGRLPPDPPPHEREILRRREEEAKKDK